MTNDKPRRTILLTYPGLLARYDQMALPACLREKVGRKDGIPGLWLLIPGDTQPLLDAKPQSIQASENHCDFVIYFSFPEDFVAVALHPAPRAAVGLCSAKFSPQIGR